MSSRRNPRSTHVFRTNKIHVSQTSCQGEYGTAFTHTVLEESRTRRFPLFPKLHANTMPTYIIASSSLLARNASTFHHWSYVVHFLAVTDNHVSTSGPPIVYVEKVQDWEHCTLSAKSQKPPYCWLNLRSGPQD